MEVFGGDLLVLGNSSVLNAQCSFIYSLHSLLSSFDLFDRLSCVFKSLLLQYPLLSPLLLLPNLQILNSPFPSFYIRLPSYLPTITNRRIARETSEYPRNSSARRVSRVIRLIARNSRAVAGRSANYSRRYERQRGSLCKHVPL